MKRVKIKARFDSMNEDSITIFGVEYIINGEFESIEFENEVFEFNEGKGDTITSNNGTVATIKTSAAQAEKYINNEIWIK